MCLGRADEFRTRRALRSPWEGQSHRGHLRGRCAQGLAQVSLSVAGTECAKDFRFWETTSDGLFLSWDRTQHAMAVVEVLLKLAHDDKRAHVLRR